MLSPPHDLALDALTGALTRQWGVVVASVDYRPVGFGSHHWTVTDPAGTGWFVTVDDLEAKRDADADSADDAFDRLDRALDTARALHDTGAAFVLAPLPTAGGAAVARIADRYAASLYPLIDGESFDFGGYPAASIATPYWTCWSGCTARRKRSGGARRRTTWRSAIAACSKPPSAATWWPSAGRLPSGPPAYSATTRPAHRQSGRREGVGDPAVGGRRNLNVTVAA